MLTAGEGQGDGVSPKKPAVDNRQRTPPRKIRASLREFKHTSLAFLVGKSYAVRLSSAQRKVRVAVYVTPGG